jgi:hypothetical protein
MEYNQRIIDLVSMNVHHLHKILSIEKFDDNKHIAHFIKISMYNHEPSFLVDYTYLDIKADLRNAFIEELLNNKRDDQEEVFDVESIIYSDEQLKRLEELRSDEVKTWRDNMVPPGIDFKEEIRQVKMEWANSFSVGETVYYKGHHATITFKHQSNNLGLLTNGGGFQLWSVRVGEDEYRYVCGTVLSKRKVERAKPLAQKDKRPEDKRLEKLSTERLLKMYKAGMKRNRGIGNTAIKRILDEREHLKKGEGKTIIVPH